MDNFRKAEGGYKMDIIEKMENMDLDSKEDEYIEKFKQQQEKISEEKLDEGEIFKHCIDKSYDFKFYDYKKAISNYGRVWSIERTGKILNLTNTRQYNKGYWKIDRSKDSQKLNKHNKGHFLVAHLVAYYFLNGQEVYENFEIDDLKVHHIHNNKTNIEKYGNSKFINYYTNLQYVTEDEHKKLSAIEKATNVGIPTEGIQEKVKKLSMQLEKEGIDPEKWVEKIRKELNMTNIMAPDARMKKIIENTGKEENGFWTGVGMAAGEIGDREIKFYSDDFSKIIKRLVLYTLLNKAKKEKDEEAVSVLKWTISELKLNKRQQYQK